MENPLTSGSVTQAVVLAGGLGTRLGALTEATPKPLLPCGDRPFLAWLLREFCRFGIQEVLLLTGHLADKVEETLPAIAATLPRPLRIACLREQQQAGTGGAVFQAGDRLAERFLLCNGDSWLDFNLGRLLADAANDPNDVIGRMVLRRLDDASRYGVAETADDRITGFRERPAAGQPGTINAGMYLFDRRVLDVATPVCALERDILPRLATLGALRGTIADGYFIDIGIPVDFARAQIELPVRLRRRALLLDHGAVLDHPAGAASRFELAPNAVSTIKAASDAGWHVFLLADPPGRAGQPDDQPPCAAPCRRTIETVRAAGGTIDDLRYRRLPTTASMAGDRGAAPSPLPEIADLLASWQLDPPRCLLVSSLSADLAAAAAAGVPAHRFPGNDLAACVLPLLARLDP